MAKHLAKHLKEKTKSKYRIISISKKVLMLLVMIILTCFAVFEINSYGKYVLNKEVTIAVKTAEYYFSAEAEIGEHISEERNN